MTLAIVSDWRHVALIAFGILAGIYLLVNGLALAFRPNLFLRLYDWENRGDCVGRSASWRKDVHNTDWKALGIAFAIAAVCMLWELVKVLRLR